MTHKFNLWIGGLLVLVVGVVLWGRAALIICRDGMEVDEPLLQELCGISQAEYFSTDFDPQSCPEAEQAVRMVGGCDTDWASVIMITAWTGGGYVLVSGIIFLIRQLLNRKKQEEPN